jgi:hypothetical protein
VTLAVSMPRETELRPSLHLETRDHRGRALHDGDSVRTAPQIDVAKFAPLLEEPAIALWAAEASERYQVSALGALGLLAQALLLDGER